MSGWAWDAESKLRLAPKPQDDGMIAQAAGQSAASATLKRCFSCREEDDIEITHSALRGFDHPFKEGISAPLPNSCCKSAGSSQS